MKYRILALTLMLMALLTVTVSAADYEYSITAGSDFITAQNDDDLTEISKKLNMTVSEVSSYFNKNGLLYLAVSDDIRTQIRISAFTDNFSSTVNDISQLDDNALHEFMSAVSEDDDSTCELVTNNGRKFIMVKDTLNYSQGVYTVTQYITICSNKTFYFAGYNDGQDTSPQIKSAFESFTLQEVLPEAPNFTLYTVLIISGIVLFAAVAVIMIIGIIKARSKSTLQEEAGEDDEN